MQTFKMKVRLSSLFLGLFLASCSDTLPDTGDAGETVRYDAGVFVVNEGPFNGTGSITWHDPATGETVQDVFGLENGGAALGQFVQSMTLHNGKGYIVVNGANKIVVVDAGTFKYEGEITGLALPRFFLPVDDNTAYISQWGADGLTGSLAKVNLNTLQITQTIPTGKGPEKMIRKGNLILVANSGGFGLDSTVSVVNFVQGLEFARDVVLNGKNPGALMSDVFQGGRTFVLSRGYFLESSPTGQLSAMFSFSQLPDQSWQAPAYSEDLCRSPQKDALYFTGGGGIYRVLSGGSPEKILDVPAYGLGCHPQNGNLYCADAKDFSSAGEVRIFSPAGALLSSFQTGIAPGEIVFIE
jgi:hypothetical protein